MTITAEPDLLLRGLLLREPAAFAELVQLYQHRLFNFALRYLGGPEEAEEAVQDAFVKAHRALYGRLPAERVRNLALNAWLYKITLNVCRDRLRRATPATAPLTGAEEHPAADGWSDPARSGERAALRGALLRELLLLPPRYRAAVVLRLVEGLPYDEVAGILGLPAGTVKSLVHRGARSMRPGLAAWWRVDLLEESK
ncbi:MAG: RNA polymerase sigma factor [Chloroflexota bacterium]